MCIRLREFPIQQQQQQQPQIRCQLAKNTKKPKRHRWRHRLLPALWEWPKVRSVAMLQALILRCIYIQVYVCK